MRPPDRRLDPAWDRRCYRVPGRRVPVSWQANRASVLLDSTLRWSVPGIWAGSGRPCDRPTAAGVGYRYGRVRSFRPDPARVEPAPEAGDTDTARTRRESGAGGVW